MVDPGNAVSADQTVLTTIVSTSPIHFSFQGSEASLLGYERRGDKLDGAPVRIRLQGQQDYAISGRIDFVDNALSNGSGTITVRAVVPNPDGKLRPGMFGQLQLAASAPHAAVMVPDTAIVTDAARRLVYVIGDKNVVQARPVELGPVIDGLRVIRSGITAKDRVVVGGIQRAMPGKPAKIEAGRIGADGKVVPAKAAAKPAAAGAAAGKGGAQ